MRPDDRIPPQWLVHGPDLESAPVVLVIGPAEAGKTTFTAWLANVLLARGASPAIVDADVGQSEIGPPATVGLGAVRAPLTRSGDAELVDLEFVGVTSPGRRPWQVAAATGRLVARARPRFDRIIVDTSGFVTGGFAAAVKQRKVAAVDPDVVVAIQVGEECEHILRGLASRPRPRVIRLPAVRGGRPRSPAVRRRHRAAALARYFAEARVITLDTSPIAVRSIAGDPLTLDTVPAGTLVALRGADGTTVGLGVLKAAEAAHATLAVRTTHDRDVTAMVVGEATLAG